MSLNISELIEASLNWNLVSCFQVCFPLFLSVHRFPFNCAHEPSSPWCLPSWPSALFLQVRSCSRIPLPSASMTARAASPALPSSHSTFSSPVRPAHLGIVSSVRLFLSHSAALCLPPPRKKRSPPPEEQVPAACKMIAVGLLPSPGPLLKAFLGSKWVEGGTNCSVCWAGEENTLLPGWWEFLKIAQFA